MKRLLVALLLAVPAHSYSQAIPFEQRGPIASLTASAVNIVHYDDQTGHTRTLWGWSATPEFNLTRRIGFQADVVSLFMRSVYPGQNRLIVAAGPRCNFAPIFRLAPFAFAEAGGVKATAQGSPIIDWMPAVKVGVGFSYRASKRLALTIVPGEYMGQKEGDGTWDHSFTARAGLTFNFYR